jgi:ribosome-binding protein aMBF1 (putative translation factor)
MSRRVKKTGLDKFFDDQMESASFAKNYAEARAEVDAIDGMVRALDDAREKSGLTKADLAAAIDARPEVVRRLFTQKDPNPTLSTLIRLAAALGYRVELVREVGRGRSRRRTRAAA